MYALQQIKMLNTNKNDIIINENTKWLSSLENSTVFRRSFNVVTWSVFSQTTKLTSLAIDRGGRLFLLINNLFNTILLNLAFVLRARNLYSCRQNISNH